MSEKEMETATVAAVQGIAGRPDLEPQEKISLLLASGNEWFKTSSALVSQVLGSRYVIVNCVSEEAEVDPGTEFDLEDTYCSHTLVANGPLAFHKAGSSDISGHPCYDMFRLETYIAAPIMIGDEPWGTVNFTAIEAREPFRPQDLDVMTAISAAVGAELIAAGHAATVQALDRVT
ncbi:GAF domain-containing protein [Leisingera sp. D0M16]|uniref:GAF domain-containing protein n=1 Tax=Leisingera coralii TaxID=3351347 RepID=UPI003B801C88